MLFLSKLYRHGPQIPFPKKLEGKRARPEEADTGTDTERQMKGTETDTGSQMKGCEGKQMKGNKAAAAAKSSPEWRS